MTERYIPDEVKALGGQFLPWKEEGYTFRTPDGPPKGLRLSEPCGACCIVDYFQHRKNVVNNGISLDGHLKADIFVQGLLMPNTDGITVEKEYPWATKGTSGMDCIVDPWDKGLLSDMERNPYVGHYEFKTTSDQGNVKPKLANREQVIRQRVVMALHHGVTDAELFNSYIFIISKEGKKTNWVFKPFLIEPTAEELAYAQRDVDLRVQVFDDLIEDEVEDPFEHPLLKQMRRKTCTRCFPLEKAPAPPGVDKILNGGRKDWDRWTEFQRTDKWMKKVKKEIRPLVPMGQQVETEHFLIRHTESGKLYIDAKNLN